MALLTTIDGIPLYTTIQEAIGWAANSGLNGYHQHTYKEQLGYMGGTSHAAAVQGPVAISTPISIPTPVSTPVSTPASTTTTTTTTSGTGYSGSGSTGGGGGY